ncbi:MAG: nicotinate-nucleotide adenylyltransferase [Pseudomonadota bacterium]
MLGILGGSFDPVHHGHLRLAVELRQDLGLSEVRLVPSNLPPHRAPPLAAAQQRLDMLRVAVAGEPGLVVDECEIRRGGVSYTIDTLISLRAELGSRPLCLILGMDAFLGLHTWRRWRELITLAHLVVAHRPGWDAAAATGEIAVLLAAQRADGPHQLAAQAAGLILCRPLPQLDISSSRIRALLAQGKSARYLAPDATLDMARGIYAPAAAHPIIQS